MPELEQDGERIGRALAALLGPAAKSAELRKLGGGIGHVSYVVELPEQSYVLKLKRSSSAPILALEEEIALLGAAAAANITAEPVGLDAATDALLIRFVPHAKALTEAATRDPANVSRIAGLLRRLHAIAGPLRSFEPLRHAENYITAAARHRPLTTHEEGLAAVLRSLVVGYESRYPPTVVCHNDLVAANILDAGTELVLVDFEYAARAAPILDLASLAAMNDYEDRDRRELLRAYYGSAAGAVSPADLAQVVRMVRLMAYFWALALPEELRVQNARYLRIADRTSSSRK